MTQIQEVNLTIDQAMYAAVEMTKQGKIKEAEAVFRNVLKLEPDNFHALNHLSTILAEKKEYYEALYRVDRALTIQKRNPYARSNRGMILGQLGHFDESTNEFRRAVAIAPDNAIFWSNLGNTLEKSRKYNEAFITLNKAISLDPKHGFPFLNRGVVLMRLGRQQEAIESFNRALELDPNIHEARCNRAHCHMLLGNYAEGWPDYEYRLKIPEEGTYYVGPFEQPKWTGEEPLESKTILLHGEQGLGDTLQFMRYVAKVQERNPKEILFVMHHALWPVLESRGMHIVYTGETYPPFDYYSPIMSLPLAFKTVEETIPPPWDLGNIQPTMPPSSKLRVGVCWAGNWKQKNDHNRSIPLSKFTICLQNPDIEYVNLQKDIREMDKEEFSKLSIPDNQSALGTLVDTAGVIRSCDLVISVDTSVSHMAGTLGTPVWMLTPSLSPHWPWILGKSDTKWYPSMRVWRQQLDGTWDATLAQVNKTLRGLVAQSAAKAA